MSSLSKITITEVERPKFWLKIESIHPDAPSLGWYLSQSEEDIKANLLFRTLLVIEESEPLDKEPSSFLGRVYAKLVPRIEEEHGEAPPLTRHTEITEYGSDLLLPVAGDVLASVKVAEQDINDNWQKGLIANFNPYKKENPGIPYIVFEIELAVDSDLSNHLDKPVYSSTGVTCRDK